jgi:hypothetical protein
MLNKAGIINGIGFALRRKWLIPLFEPHRLINMLIRKGIFA